VPIAKVPAMARIVIRNRRTNRFMRIRDHKYSGRRGEGESPRRRVVRVTGAMYRIPLDGGFVKAK
jgi:hypothetical protein